MDFGDGYLNKRNPEVIFGVFSCVLNRYFGGLNEQYPIVCL